MAHDRQLFVNIVVSDLVRSKAFFAQLGFTFDPRFTNDEAAAMIVGTGAFFMLHTPASMKRFTPKPTADLTTQTAALYAVSVGSREEVDSVADTALAAGGSKAGEPQDHGFMYQRSFLDPDGHYFEVFYMDLAAAEKMYAGQAQG